MRIYLASRYSRHPELREYKAQLEQLGHVVTSRWLEGYSQRHGEVLADLVKFHRDLTPIPQTAALFAKDDVEDVLSSDLIICFTEPSESASSRGGRHVEFGLALATHYIHHRPIQLVVVGPLENVFYCLPEVKHYPSFPDLLASLANTSVPR